MEIVKICIIAVIFGVLIVFLRGVNPELAMLTLVSSAGIILFLTIRLFNGVFSVFERLSQISGVSGDVIGLIIKITVVCYIVEFSVGAIEDFGLKSLADKLSLMGKLVILGMSVPLLENLINVIVSVAG
ncbi:MAG: hypothetical protein J5762_06070 [Clostridia bacterium]|nr:hypothetical protein [Clostridia bacterium]